MATNDSPEAALFDASAAFRGTMPPEDASILLLALVAMRKFLEIQRLPGKKPRTGSRTGSFDDLAGARSVPSTMDEMLRALATTTSPDGAPTIAAIRLVLGTTSQNAARPLTLATQAVARIRHELLFRPELATAAQQLLIASSPNYSEYQPADSSVVRLMLALAGPLASKRLCDPWCGIGAVLLEAAKLDTPDRLHGFEARPRIAAIAHLLSFLADARAEVQLANVLTSPPVLQGSPYDAVVSRLPFGGPPPKSIHIEAVDRFRFGLPTRDSDWLFAQHALSVLAPAGSAVLLLGKGALFRGGVEANVRRGMISADLIDLVVGLPPGYLPATSIASAILVLRRDRPRARRGSILLVNVPPQDPATPKGVLVQSISEAILLAHREYGATNAPVVARVVAAEELVAGDSILTPERYTGAQYALIASDHVLNVAEEGASYGTHPLKAAINQLEQARTDERMTEDSWRSALKLLVDTSAASSMGGTTSRSGDAEHAAENSSAPGSDRRTSASDGSGKRRRAISRRS